MTGIAELLASAPEPVTVSTTRVGRGTVWSVQRPSEAEHPAEMVESVVAAAAASLIRETEGFLA